MTDRKYTSTATSTTAGVLRPDELTKHVRLERMDCAESLAPWVENYWMLQWELPAERTYQSSTLPHPACTLSVERGHLREGIEGIEGAVVVTGVLTRCFDVTPFGAPAGSWGSSSGRADSPASPAPAPGHCAI